MVSPPLTRLSPQNLVLPLKLSRLVSWCAWLLPAAVQAAERVDYTRDVRPILSQACFKCHGPDSQTRQAQLRLDSYEGLISAERGTPALVPGDAEHSELMRRILSVDPDERMPPPGSQLEVTAEQQQVLRRWIEQGAAWEEHWSFLPPQRPEIPQVQRPEWCRNEIDRFILQRLEQVDLVPAQEAEPHMLLRRLYLDLIGLPPTVAEADDWLARVWPVSADGGARRLDEAAYHQLVDSLLDSPHYGERWGRRWLDLARYADSNGYEKDRERSIWPYRDWVVDALNRDLPFDQFTIEQLAGDMLPEATVQQRIATGFHRNSMLNEEGGIDPLEFRFHAMTDRVATTGTTWLGMTLGCCQCHTHKYDPISHTEYFQLMALLNNADEPMLELPQLFTEGDWERVWQSNRQQATELLSQLPERWPLPESTPETPEARRAAFQQAYAQWLATERGNAVEWKYIQPLKATSNLPILTIEADHSIFASGDTAKRDDYVIELAAQAQPMTALRLEALPDPRLPARGPGSTYYEGTLGDFYLVELTAHTATGQAVEFAEATETYAKNRFGKNPVAAKFTIDGDVQTGWSVDGRQGERHVAVYQLREPLAAGQTLVVKLTFGRHFASSLGRFRFSGTAAPHTTAARTFDSEVERLLMLQPAELTVEQDELLQREFCLLAPELATESAKIRQLLAPPELPTTLVLAERPAAHPRPTFRHHRGEYLQPAEEVQPGVPAIFSFAKTPPRDRLSFAKWLVHEQHPLTARVAVNRLWGTLFGTGIVATEQDFGLQGEAPSHPELLDWLAWQFVHVDGWSQKQMLRRVVSSRTYRQSSAVNPAARAIDPQNRWLSYAPRFRVEAEILRDSLLTAAGLLNRRLGGPPVRPPQAAGITEVAFGSPRWEVATGEDRYRRSLYTFVKRTAPFAMTATFDAPSGEACIAQRTRSNSPLQALTLLNDVMLLEFARAAGKGHAQVMTQSAEKQLRDELQSLFREVLVRPASETELQWLVSFWEEQRQHFASQPALAEELVGEAVVDLPQAAAWVATARGLFALDETQTRE